MQRFNLSAWAVGHPALMMFLIAMLGLAGLLSYRSLGRAEDPSFTIKVVIVSAMWPGASAADMQNQVADPIEKKLQELPYIDKVTTYTKPSFTAMQVAFKDNTPGRDVPELFYQLRKKISDIKDDLPAGLIGPSLNDEYGDVDSILYMLTADGADYAQMKKVAEALRQRLLKVKDVTKVNLYGTQEEKIYLEFSHAKLATLGITPEQMFASLARQNAVVPAGVVETRAQRVPLRVTGALDGVKAVAETPVEANGRVFRLGDIATVSHGYADPPSFVVRQKGKSAIGIGIVMAKGANILELGPNIANATASFLAAVPQGFDLEQIADQPVVVELAVGEFVHSFMEALAIVLFVSFLALGWRTGIVVALSVPLVLAIVFIVMNAMGLDLQRITLGALIIALGLLVDDAIIAVEMMVVKMEQGWSRIRAASFAWESTAFPMLTGTLVTAAGFLPIGFANSSVGEYAGGIFWVVAISLVASWLVAVMFTPYIGVKLLPNFKSASRHEHAIYETRIYQAFRRVIEWCVNRRIAVVLATAGVLALAVVAFGRVQQQFFPLSERPELFFQLRLPEGTAFGTTLKSVQEAEALLNGDPDVATYTAYVGQGSPRFWLGLNPQLPDESFAEIVIVSKDVEPRERIKARLEKAVAGGALSEARVRVDRFNFGPPVGFPVQFRVIGPDARKAREVAYRVLAVMRADPRVVDPHLNWNEQAPYLKLVVDQDRVRALGMTPQDIAQSLSMLISGLPITTVRDGIEKVQVVARAVSSERLDLAHLGDLALYSRNGVAVPLSQIAHVEYAHEEPILWRNQPRHVDYRALRCHRWRAAAGRHERHLAEAGVNPREPRAGLPARNRRRDRGIAERQCLDFRSLSRDDLRHAHAVDDPAPEHFATDSGFSDSAAWYHRGVTRLECRRPAVRIRRTARADRAGWNDYAQCRDSGRSDRGGRQARRVSARGDCRGDRATGAAGCPYGARRNSCHDPLVALGVLGADGHHHHGWAVRGNVSDLAVPAKPLCFMVPQAPG
jgi:multidrug efflux pump subunit AcrB